MASGSGSSQPEQQQQINTPMFETNLLNESPQDLDSFRRVIQKLKTELEMCQRNMQYLQKQNDGLYVKFLNEKQRADNLPAQQPVNSDDDARKVAELELKVMDLESQLTLEKSKNKQVTDILEDIQRKRCRCPLTSTLAPGVILRCVQSPNVSPLKKRPYHRFDQTMISPQPNWNHDPRVAAQGQGASSALAGIADISVIQLTTTENEPDENKENDNDHDETTFYHKQLSKYSALKDKNTAHQKKTKTTRTRAQQSEAVNSNNFNIYTHFVAKVIAIRRAAATTTTTMYKVLYYRKYCLTKDLDVNRQQRNGNLLQFVKRAMPE